MAEHEHPKTRKGEGPDGRWLEVSVEVPGTPEEVWEALATGPGISAWFVPTDVEPGEGGTVTQHHGDGIDAPPSRITAWEPPHRLALDDGDWQPTPTSPNGRIATEWLVEARSGGTCVVRLVTSGFGSGDDWDRALESTTQGWQTALETLRLYLTHFAREPLASLGAWGSVHGDKEAAAAALRAALGLAGKGPGDAMRAPDPAPPLAGTVATVVGEQVIVRLDEPARGLAFVATGGPGDETFAMVRLRLFGPDAADVAAREEGRWQRWLDDHLAAMREG